MKAEHLGKHAKDCITGFEGLVTGEISYITGCDQILIQPKPLDKDGKIQEPKWFDIYRCEISNVVEFELLRQTPQASDRPGGPGDENPTDHVR